MLAPHAEFGDDGKVYVLGGDIDTVRIPTATFPATAGVPLYLIGKITFLAQESGQEHHARIELIAPDETVLESVNQRLSPPPPVAGRQTKTGFVLMFSRITFPVPGEYAIRLVLDGTEARRLPLYVEQIPPDGNAST
jgi:hypothetical protein